MNQTQVYGAVHDFVQRNNSLRDLSMLHAMNYHKHCFHSWGSLEYPLVYLSIRCEVYSQGSEYILYTFLYITDLQAVVHHPLLSTDANLTMKLMYTPSHNSGYMLVSCPASLSHAGKESGETRIQFWFRAATSRRVQSDCRTVLRHQEKIAMLHRALCTSVVGDGYM